ncbi:glutathione S-transferase family protein [Pseudomonas gingeri]|uniref:glutathione S-transferase family protein n=1 Tax=Pseudomonas gingeri TaxID=117681 RepID=UPI0015A2A7EE|nr:glutathione S-transferase family protein [Pseudomonas gingeri]NWA24360.1 glutathione S-transferase family protein [Pseudomonas gingeri]
MSKSESYEFYWISGSPNAWRTMLVLEYKGIPYVSHRIDPSKGEHKTAEFLVLNPRGKVPVLTNGDVALHESIAIMAYLEKAYPERALFGSNAAETGLIWQRIFEIVNYVRDPIDDGVIRPLFRGKDSKLIQASALEVHGALKWLDGILLVSPYLAGDTLSAADFTVLPNVQMLARVGNRDEARTLELGFEDLRTTYPFVSAWLTRLEALPAYERSFPPHWRAA